MRKFLLTAVALVLGAGSMIAALPFKQAEASGAEVKFDRPVMKKAKAAEETSRWDCSYVLGNSLGAIGFKTASTYKVAIVIPENIAKQCVGSKVTDIFFFMGTSVDKNATVFITKGLEGETLWQKEVTLNLGSVSGNSFNPGQNEVILDEPYVFTGDEIAVGFEFKVPRSTNYRPYYPLCYGDEAAVNSYCDNIAQVTNAGEEWTHFGQPFPIMVGVEGDNLPTWLATVGYDMPYMIKPGENVDVVMQFANIGGNTVTGVTANAAVDGEKAESKDFTVNIAVGAVGEISITTPIPAKEGIYDISGIATKVNGDDVEAMEISDYVKSVDKGFKRRVVVEEWTGTWCGYCPRGIWGMDYMKEKYPDDFIGIAVHYDDEMEETSYINSLIETGYVSGFPGALVDRMAPVNPGPSEFTAAVTAFGGDTGFGDIKISEVKYVDEKETLLEINGSAKIGYNAADVNPVLGESQYRVAFVISENKVPGTQNNYYAGGQLGKCGGWESKGQSVKWDFDDVARDIDTYEGIEGLLPAVMEKDKDYEFTHRIELPRSVKVGSNIDVVAMLINGTTGYIENAVKVAGPQRAASIDAVAADGASAIKVTGGTGVIDITGECAAAEIYGINGVRVASAAGSQTVEVAPGLYIVRTVAADSSMTVTKVAVK